MTGILTKVSPVAKKALQTNLFNDTQLTASAVFKRFIKNTPDPVTGKNVVEYESIPVTIVEMKHTNDSVKSSSSKVEVGMMVFLVQYDDLPYKPTTRDVITIDSRNMEYIIKGIDTIFNILYLLTVVDRKNTS